MNILHELDILVIAIFLLLMLAIGMLSGRFSSSFDDYNHVGSSLRKNKFILAATVFATAVGGGTTFGLSEKIFTENLSYVYALVLTIPIDIWIAYVVIPRIAIFWDAFSVGDILASTYGELGRILAGIAVVISSIGYLAAQISVSGHLLHSIFAIDYVFAVVVSYSIVIIYTSFGGLKSVITNNILQFFTMIIAIPALTIFGIREIGFDHFIDNVPVSKYSLSDNKLLWDTIWLTLSFSVMGCYPTLIQRALLNKNSTYMTSAMVIKSIVYVFFIICIALNGLIALQIMPGALGNEALQYTINTIMPNGLKGLVVIGFLAATMSTADTDLNVASVSSAQDIFKPLFKMSNQDNLLFFARVASVAIGGISILISITFDSIVDIVLTVAGLWAPIMLVPFLSVVFNKTISQRGLVVSIISGMIGLILWQYFYSNCCMLKSIFVGTIVNGLVFVTNYYMENVRGRSR